MGLLIDCHKVRPWWAPWLTLWWAEWRLTRRDGSFVAGRTLRRFDRAKVVDEASEGATKALAAADLRLRVPGD